MTSPSDPKSRLTQSVSSGAALALDGDLYAALLASAEYADLPVAYTEVTLDIGIDAFAQLGGLFGGAALSAVVPDGVLPLGDPELKITLQTVGFRLFTATKEIGAIDCTIGFEENHQKGLRWKIAQVGSRVLELELDGLRFDWVDPGKPSSFMTAAVFGRVTIGKLPLDVTVMFPDPVITVREPPDTYVNVGDFFADFGPKPPAVLSQLFLEDFSLTAIPGSQAFDVMAMVVAEEPIVLLPGLALDDLWFEVTHAPEATHAAIGGVLLFKDKLALSFRAAVDTSPPSALSFTGAIDVPLTRAKLDGADAPAEGLSKVTVGDFAVIFTGQRNAADGVPESLRNLGVAALSFTYTHVDGSPSAYDFEGVFAEDWTLPGAGAIRATLALSASGQGGNVDGQVSADVAMDGFEFVLTYQFGKHNEIDALIDAKVGEHELKIKGSYDIDRKEVALHFDGDTTLGALLAWFVAAVSGNRYFVLPPPLDSVLGAIKLNNVSLTVNTDTKEVKFEYPLSVLSIDKITVDYVPGRKNSKKSGLQIELHGLPIPAWDPVNEQPPDLPGQGPTVELKLAAAGQHVGFRTPPDTVAAAMTALEGALAPDSWKDGTLPAAMAVSADSGWLLGAHMTFLGQADVELIFSDPGIYGLVFEVKKTGQTPPTKLDLLAGLHAEILYRKVTETIGEYEASLTLPDTIGKIDFGAVRVALPSLSLAIYTNGDFKIDVGFPHNRDFSHSCAVEAAVYGGSGGFYFAKLDGLDPQELPHIDPAKGVFNPVTEIGIGLRVGMVKGFTSGPVTARFSVMLEALFEGTFATFKRIPGPNDDPHKIVPEDYHSVAASVAIVGQLVGSLDLSIITATLNVTVYIELDLKLVAHRETLVDITASVDVDLVVTIDLYIFQIHIHLSFSATLHEQVRFGENSTAPWDNMLLPPPRAALRAAGLALAGPPAPGLPTRQVGWRPILDTASLTVYFMPQLTAGLTGDVAPEFHWYYVGQLAMSNGPSEPGGDAYAAFVRGVLRWALDAVTNKQRAQLPVPAADVDKTTVSLAQIRDLIAKLGDPDPDPHHAPQPTSEDIRRLFRYAFQITVKKPPDTAPAGGLNVGFFPIIHGMTVAVHSDGKPPQVLAAAAPLSIANLHRVKHGGPPGALRGNFLGHLDDRAPPTAGDTLSFQDRVLVDFVVIAVRAALQKVVDRALTSDATPSSIGSILAKLSEQDLDSISGMTSRFMLHGTRLPRGDGDLTTLEPLYSLTGQQWPLAPDDLRAASLGLTLAGSANDLAEWGVTIDGAAAGLALSSADTSPLIFKPSAIPPVVKLDTAGMTAAALPLTIKQPRRFHLKSGIDAADGSGVRLWRLPADLMSLLSGPGVTDHNLVLHKVDKVAGSDVPADPTTYTWVLSVDLRVRRVLAAATPGQPAAYLPNTYALSGVDQAALLQLKQLIADIQAGGAGTGTPVLGIEIASLSDSQASGSAVNRRGLTLVPVDSARTFLVQSNFSTETRPPPPPRANAVLRQAVDPESMNSFIFKLWSCGVTNSGGYYLCSSTADDKPGLSDTLFAHDDAATITAVIKLDPTKAISSKGRLPAYVSGLETRGADFQTGRLSLYVAADTLCDSHAVVPPGHIGIRVQRPVPPKPAAGSPSVDPLYNLIAARIAKIGALEPKMRGLPPLIGASTDPGGAGSWRFDHVFPLIDSTSQTASGPPPDDQNPYQYVGDHVSFDLRWTDLYGNQFGAAAPDLAVDVAHIDGLVALTRLPYMTADHVFEATANGPVALRIAVRCQPPAYAKNDDGKQRRQGDLAAYARAYWQLLPTKHGETTVSLATSLTGEKAYPLETATIAKFVGEVYAALAAATDSPAAALALELSAAIDPGDKQFSNELYHSLTVSLTVRRTGPIDKAFDESGPVRQVTVAISPRMAKSDVNAPLSLQSYADAFETAFKSHDLKLAVGASWQQGGGAQSNRLWVVRYGATGINVSFPAAQARYYAPKPFSNRLLSRAGIKVRSVQDTGALTDADNPANPVVAATDVDLDAEMRQFLEAVDEIFSAQFAIPAYLVNKDAVTSLAASRKAIAEKLLAWVTDLSSGKAYQPSIDDQPPTAGSTEPTPKTPAGHAANRYRQECLIRLAAFYDMASVAVVPAQVGPAAAPTLNLFGHPTAKTDVDSAEFSLTSGKLAMPDPGACLAIGLFPKAASHFRSYGAVLEFQIDAIEHDIETLTLEGTRYRAGSWLRFVKPAQVPLGSVKMPIPLRAFPLTPHLVRQYAGELRSPGQADQNEMLRQAASWALNGELTAEYAAQDTLDLRVELNFAPRVQMLGAAGTSKDLLDTLVEFKILYPQLKAIFTRDHLSSVRSPPNADAVKALRAALKSFSDLVSTVQVCAWTLQAAPLVPQGPGAPAETALLDSRFLVTEGASAADPDDEWICTVARVPAADAKKVVGILPQVLIEGYRPVRSQPGQDGSAVYKYVSVNDAKVFLKARDAWQDPRRTISLAPIDAAAGIPLDILSEQNGRLSMMIRRNADLPDVFHYETPRVTYRDVLQPLLDRADRLDMAGLGPGIGAGVQRRTIADHLKGFFAALTNGLKIAPAMPAISFQAIASFDYAAATDLAALRVRLPIVFYLPTPIGADGDVSALAKHVETWLTANGMTPQRRAEIWPTANIAFDFSFFAEPPDGARPLLRLRDVRLACSAIEGLSG